MITPLEALEEDLSFLDADIRDGFYANQVLDDDIYRISRPADDVEDDQ